MLVRALIVSACLVLAAGFIARANHSEPVTTRAALASFPMQITDWHGFQDPPLDKSVLEVLGADDYLSRTYVTGKQSGVGFFIGFYESQRQGDTMHSPLNCLPGAGWEPVSKSGLSIPVAAAANAPSAPIVVNRYLIQKGLDRQLVLYWYQSHGRVVASEYWGKFFLVKDSIQLNRTDGAMVRIIAPVRSELDGDEAGAEHTAVRFVQAIFPLLGQYLPS